MYRLITSLLLVPFFTLAQKPVKHHIQISAGTSFNGTGDIRGFAFNSEYGHLIKKKFFWYAGMGGTIHDKVEPIFYTGRSGNPIDASVRATTAGFQVTGVASYSFVKTNKHDFSIRIGPLLRYQSTSYWDMLEVFPPAGTGLPFPVVAFINLTPQRTVAVGATGQIGYNFTTNNKLSFGVLGTFQFDSNGDVLRNAYLVLGRRF